MKINYSNPAFGLNEYDNNEWDFNPWQSDDHSNCNHEVSFENNENINIFSNSFKCNNTIS
jgi:hypothetical protein